MKALWLENKTLKLRRDLDVPRPQPGEALVRVRKAGICNTDLEMVKGYYPFQGILGHEFVGTVETGPRRLIGKRVVGEINAVCHQCLSCKNGREKHCANRTVLGIVNRNGAFADYLTLPTENLHEVPDHIPDDYAVFVEPLAAALEIKEQVQIKNKDRVLVIGDGKLGQLIAQTLHLRGCFLHVAGRHDHKLHLLKKQGIATFKPDGIEERSYDFSVECTGNPDGFTLARKALRPKGTLIMKSTYASELTMDASSLVVDEITLVGSRCGPFPEAIKLLSKEKVDVKPLIQGNFKVDQGLEAFEHANKPGMLKVIVSFK